MVGLPAFRRPLYLHTEDKVTSLVNFRAQFVQPIIKRIQNGGENMLATSEVIPLCGVIFYRVFGGDGGYTNFDFYLAAENGEMAKYRSITQNYTIYDTIFDADEAKQRVAAMLGIKSDQIGLAEGVEEHKHGGMRFCVRWKFLCLTIAEFEQLRKPKKVSVVAERTNGRPSQRWVAPNAVRVRDAKFDFDVKTAELRFVAKHNNSIEYVTEDGIKVFDNRRKGGIASFGGIYGKEKEVTFIPARESSLKSFLYDIWRGSKAKPVASKEAEQLRDYAGWALERVATQGNIIANKEGGLIAKGIELLYGKPFVPAMELFRGRSIIEDGFQWNRRELLHDADNSGTWDDEDTKLDARYVVITDLPPEKK